ncbi:hypothetical protein [Aquimarina muelleri]|uniref:Uncharacterized protein n=1 Tax=Aquimarina muelleri TaxID=279356 RepID=A0A918N2V5_9FLAO|nr:hypothetical protein [Aquimarina muelleri]GGX07848.1 hypothetical protein GCM10007384_07020 [Aquimarina muelleri]
MITHKDKIIQNLFKQVNGMDKIEVYDILLKIETMLRDFKSPIQYEEIKKQIENISIKTNISAADRYGYCYLHDHCQYMKVYKIKTLLPNFLGGEYLYFITPWQLKLMEYNRDNLQITFAESHLEAIALDFLKKHPPKSKNPVTDRLRLLELLDQIDSD